MRQSINWRNSALSRRAFARDAALAVASAAVVPATLERSPQSAAGRQNPGTQAPAVTPVTAEDQAQADERVAAILRKYGDRFSAEQKDEIRRLSLLLQKPLDRLRAFPLGNSDQPATVLKLVSSAKPTPPKAHR